MFFWYFCFSSFVFPAVCLRFQLERILKILLEIDIIAKAQRKSFPGNEHNNRMGQPADYYLGKSFAINLSFWLFSFELFLFVGTVVFSVFLYHHHQSSPTSCLRMLSFHFDLADGVSGWETMSSMKLIQSSYDGGEGEDVRLRTKAPSDR